METANVQFDLLLKVISVLSVINGVALAVFFGKEVFRMFAPKLFNKRVDGNNRPSANVEQILMKLSDDALLKTQILERAQTTQEAVLTVVTRTDKNLAVAMDRQLTVRDLEPTKTTRRRKR